MVRVWTADEVRALYPHRLALYINSLEGVKRLAEDGLSTCRCETCERAEHLMRYALGLAELAKP